MSIDFPTPREWQNLLREERNRHTRAKKEIKRLRTLLFAIAAQTDPAWAQRLASEALAPPPKQARVYRRSPRPLRKRNLPLI